MDEPTTAAAEGNPSLTMEQFQQALSAMAFAKGVTRSVITARVGNQMGSGKVEVEVSQYDEAAGGIVIKLTGNPVDVFNINGIEIPIGIDVVVAPVQGSLSIINFDKKCSVRIPGMNSLFFLTGFPREPKGLEIKVGDWIDVPPNVNAWPEGVMAPEQILCRSKDDPKHYKIFKYRREVDGEEWEETGLNFGGTFTAESWESFARSLASLNAIHAAPDGEDD